MSQITTNAAIAATAAVLSAATVGRFRSLCLKLQGQYRGRGADRKLYGNDLVHFVFFGGVHMGRLLQRSLDRLEDIDPNEVVDNLADRGIVDKDGNPITRVAVCKAIADLAESLRKSLDGDNTGTSSHAYESLMVDGKKVRGARVYKCVKDDPDHKCRCRNCTGKARAPVPGTIYVSGLLIGKTVVEPAENGPIPASKSRADVIAKRVIRSRLPIGRYREWRLDPNGDYAMVIGPNAVHAATQHGTTCDPDEVQAAVGMMAG